MGRLLPIAPPTSAPGTCAPVGPVADPGAPDGQALVRRAILRARIRVLLGDPAVARAVAARLGPAAARSTQDSPPPRSEGFPR